MALRANISKNVPSDQVTLKVPHEFRAAIDARMLDAGPYTVVAFPGMRGESSSIVDSALLSKIFAGLESGGALVVVAHNFTAEARELLHQRGALHFSQNDFFWSDASLARIRNSGPR